MLIFTFFLLPSLLRGTFRRVASGGSTLVLKILSLKKGIASGAAAHWMPSASWRMVSFMLGGEAAPRSVSSQNLTKAPMFKLTTEQNIDIISLKIIELPYRIKSDLWDTCDGGVFFTRLPKFCSHTADVL